MQGSLIMSSITPCSPTANISPAPSAISHKEIKSNPSKITKIITSKEWVLPPRPKPGRKPSAEAPATKRKAQNRAAQRAFRERRANRVSELETQLLDLEREKSINEGLLTNQVKSLQKENESIKKMMDEMKSTMDLLKRQFMSAKPPRSPINKGSPNSAPSPRNSSSAVTTPSSNTPILNKRKSSVHKPNSNRKSFDINNKLSPLSSVTQIAPKTPNENDDSDISQAASAIVNFKNTSRNGSISSAASSSSKNFKPNYSLQEISPASSNVSSQSPQYMNNDSASNVNITNDSNNKEINRSKIYTVKEMDASDVQSPGGSTDINSNGTKEPFMKFTTENDDKCGICTKDECICESIGIKHDSTQQNVDSFQEKPELLFGNFEPQAAVPLKRRKENPNTSSSLSSFANNNLQEVDFTYLFNGSASGNSVRSTSTVSVNNDMANNNNYVSKFKKMPKLQSKDGSNSIMANNDSLFKSPSNGFGQNDAINDTTMNDADLIAPEDQCGFCSEDTPCVCREIAKQRELTQLKDNMITNEINDFSSENMDNKNSANENTVQIKLRDPANNNSNETKDSDIYTCTGNPGTCLQCQKDPMSTLFCTTIAQQSKQQEVEEDKEKIKEKEIQQEIQKEMEIEITSSMMEESKELPVSRSLSQSMETTGSSTPSTPFSNPPLLTASNLPKFSSFSSVSSMTNTPLPSFARTSSVTSLPALSELEINNPGKHFIPCSDAYKTLSRHANFRSAAFNKIINNLNTKGMFVEVESVVNCLRELDRNFGNN